MINLINKFKFKFFNFRIFKTNLKMLTEIKFNMIENQKLINNNNRIINNQTKNE